ncbi:MAG: 4Fe-4S dicluster domain-containing protein [Coriobacteriia bacterium]|nr:4Fe-4S dicluster domain-containing protein [Coriobacteriia bacterium]
MTQYLNVDGLLGIDRFNVDEHTAHIELNKDWKNEVEIDRLVRACPAGLYRYNDCGELIFDYAGCLECGTCRVLGLGNVVEKWEWPQGGFGVSYRYG